MGTITVLVIAAEASLPGTVRNKGGAKLFVSLLLVLAFIGSDILPFIVICREYHPGRFGKSVNLSSTLPWTLPV